MASSYLVLEDGTVYEGESFGYRAAAFGEVVFATGMCGYQESLTDPSYQGQILVMTFPLVGNYGTVDGFCQSDRVHARALVVKEYCREPSADYHGKTIDEFLKDNKVPGISGVDTRDLVIRIRSRGTMNGAITEDRDAISGLIADLKKRPAPSAGNLVSEVSCQKIHEYRSGKDLLVGLLDCGEKSGILRDLRSRYDVIMFPYDTPADVITESGVKGVLVSNGPGDPAQPVILKTTVRTVASLTEQLPVYGICFGNQLTALALGGKTYKMKFGHRGCNQPVKYEGRVFITSQNHGFAVDADSLKGTGLIADQFNVNDGTVEGMRHENLPVFTTQYHPEASPGPWDTAFVFDRFGQVIQEGRL
ncbi:MAG: glutamine-hydrolyzing carbamoyl-phosphate synthase small subunit [Candidatus Methanomethylophilus sp.]|nr:glutamine-hydrolyzing carbamoyl-phosphate synthase small subunit [Methanomethylophilus sp.]